MKWLYRWILSALALIAVAYVLPGVHVESFGIALITAAVLGLINTLVRPVLLILTLPITLLTLGLFTLVINALMFYLAAAIIPGFEVSNFWYALLGALVYGALTLLINQLLGYDD